MLKYDVIKRVADFFDCEVQIKNPLPACRTLGEHFYGGQQVVVHSRAGQLVAEFRCAQVGDRKTAGFRKVSGARFNAVCARSFSEIEELVS